MIKRISKQNPQKGQFVLSEPFVCLVNSYYYVQPGEDSDYFFRAIQRIITDSYTFAELNSTKQNSKDSFALALQSTAAQLSVSLINESFNKSFFESQINRISIEDLCDRELLKKYLNLLDKKQLKEFLMLDKKGDGLYSMSTSNYITMRQCFNRKCREIDQSIPCMDEAFEDYQEFEKENQYYYFDCLSKDFIESVILKYIDIHLDKAVFTAKALYYSNIDFAYNCLTLLFYFQEYWGNKILNPLSLEEVEIKI